MQMPRSLRPCPATAEAATGCGTAGEASRWTSWSSIGAALALADMAGSAGKPPPPPPPPQLVQPATTQAMTQYDDDEEEMATTRLSLQLGNVGIQSSPSCSSAGRPAPPPPVATTAPAPPPPAGYGPRPRHMLTEGEKEAKRLRRVLANRESARQTILRRQAIRDELARKVADLSTQNESMKKERETVMQEYLTLKETNKQLKEQAPHLPLSLF
ncbi:hypothetical protein GUJ93_ZPchr0009g226 [Zizania palustris]|uniref:BZIP domain-containing protein n=1 Tax=Zizania palustris TaxID=103762 RepID=A0A8J5RWB3_ZIZPA|nr:hypothetical protein GUJ93_ZPchr0009g226 [Zizania palustris]